MALREQPYFPFYVQDYLTDEKLLMCSWKTQGIYVRILCNLHKQEVYGAILFKQNSKQTDKQSPKQNESIARHFAEILCRLIPCQHEDMASAIVELIDNNVLLFDGEKLYQKRMYNDGVVSFKRSQSARKGGGNPALKSSSESKNLFKQKDKQNTENEIEYDNEYEYKEKEGVQGEKKRCESFEKFRQAYLGRKNGYDRELKVFQKHGDWKKQLPELTPALEREIEWRQAMAAAGEWCAAWPDLQTWLNQRRWEQELPEVGAESSEKFTYEQVVNMVTSRQITGDQMKTDFEIVEIGGEKVWIRKKQTK